MEQRIGIKGKPDSSTVAGHDADVVISLSEIEMNYNGTTNALSSVNLKIQSGEFLCLLGPSGCGKSTLLNILAGFVKPSAGKAIVGGKRIVGPDWERGVVFQSPVLYPWLNVQQNVEFGLKMRGVSKVRRTEVSDKYIGQVGLSDFKHHKPYELSGGMRQRTALARVLANNPRIILMDEPFGALDAITRSNMQSLTRIIWSENKTTFFLITHDVDEALSLGTRVLVMSSRPGRIIEQYATEFTYHITGNESDRTRVSKEYLDLRETILSRIHAEMSGAEYCI